MISHSGYHPATCAIYSKLIAADLAWVRSAEGRRLIARALRHVRNTVSRSEAADLRDDLCIAWMIGTLHNV
ncbi:MAG: hypothetical protein ACYSVY_15765 [Planctomycetota bacterium]